MKRLALIVMSLAVVICLAPNAFSDTITFSGTVYLNGTGIGNTIHVLSLQNDGNETGSVTFAGTLTGDAKPNSNTWTASQLSALGLSATNFGIVFNPNETGPPGTDTVDVQSFTLNFFDSSGVSIGNTDTTGLPVNLLPISTGTGTSGWLMLYHNDAGTGALDLFFANDTNVLAATGSVFNTDDGPDNFYLINPLTPPPPVPEPSALLLLGSGLVGLAFYGRKTFKR